MLTPDQISRLQQSVQDGTIIRDWCQHQGFKLFKTWIDSKIADKKQDWLRAEDKDAEKIRAKATAWLEIQDEFKKWMLLGDNAQRILQEHTKELEEQALSDNPAPSSDKA